MIENIDFVAKWQSATYPGLLPLNPTFVNFTSYMVVNLELLKVMCEQRIKLYSSIHTKSPP
jgi:uncharacterized membrane protein (GlpM family)